MRDFLSKESLVNFTNQELIEHSLFYSRKERELEEKLKILLDSLDGDEEFEDEVIDFLEEDVD